MTSITIEETDVNGSCSLYVSTDPDNNNPGPLTSNITTFSNSSNTVIKQITLPSGINTTVCYAMFNITHIHIFVSLSLFTYHYAVQGMQLTSVL